MVRVCGLASDHSWTLRARFSRCHSATTTAFREVVLRHLAELSALSTDALLEARYTKFRNFGEWQGKE